MTPEKADPATPRVEGRQKGRGSEQDNTGFSQKRQQEVGDKKVTAVPEGPTEWLKTVF